MERHHCNPASPCCRERAARRPGPRNWLECSLYKGSWSSRTGLEHRETGSSNRGGRRDDYGAGGVFTAPGHALGTRDARSGSARSRNVVKALPEQPRWLIAMSRWQRTRFAWQSRRSVVRAGLLPRNRSADRGWVILGKSFSASGPAINVAPGYRVQRTTGISKLVWFLWRYRPNEVRTVTRDGSATSLVAARVRIGDCPSRLLPWRSSIRSAFRTR